MSTALLRLRTRVSRPTDAAWTQCWATSAVSVMWRAMTPGMTWMTAVTLLLAGAESTSSGDSELYKGALVPALAVLGGRASLPCSLTSEKPGDRPELVLWYRDNSGAPIYSYDARQGSLGGGVQWKDSFILASRNAEFLVNTSPPVLAIDDVREADAGEYRCRVDFKLTPTKYHRVNLTIIVPPTQPVISFPNGDIVGEELGPLTEGDRLKLSCETRGGRPSPSLSWWRGPTLLSNAHVVTSSGVLRSVLHLPAISRSDVDRTLTCHATNNNISKPLSSSVLLKTYFRPLYVRIEGRNRPLSLGRVHHVTCTTAGSRPKPVITWWINGLELQDYSVQTSLDGNETTSVLSLNASRGHNGKHLTCRVTNPEMDSTVMEDAWRITVKYPPEVRLTLGPQIDPMALREGSDVYLECRVKANPTIFKIEWLHNGHVLQPTPREGIVMSNMSLVLQRLTRHRSGHYVCRVANSEGENVSNPVQLSIQHAPACRANQRRQYHVAKHEQVTVPCLVDANPASVDFQWRLNNSHQLLDISRNRVRSSGTISEVTLKPTNDLDFGTLECISVNEIGDQRTPCYFDLIPIANPVGPPEPPSDCAIRNRTQASLHIGCTAGAAGGYPQTFHLEAYQARTHVLLSNLSSEQAEFVLGSLGPGEEVVVHVYAVSERGKSGLVTLEAGTLKVAELKTRQEDESSGLQFTPLVGILLGAIIALLLIAVAVVLTLRRVRARELRAARRDTEESREKMLSTHTLDSDRVGDKSPDVVPCTSTLLDKRKGGGSHHEARRPQRPVSPGMPSISETVSIAPDSSLPRRLASLEYLDTRLECGETSSLRKSPSIEMFPSRMAEIPGFPKSPAPCSHLHMVYDSTAPPSEAGSEGRDRKWHESVV
ncbi:nephrin-like [Amphibalanus amphitrite]|uniref:nephrin-like n=1 Tax=Amphibalanus amphitrite TaxID=1232801 RepID=UPI001C928E86|nr:nephrin-like [Amphibalanus amphitrite]